VNARDATTRSGDPFSGYPLDSGKFDEAFTEHSAVRDHYAHVVAFFRRLSNQDLARLHQTIDTLLREQGITFSLLSDEDGLERTLPLDPVPRVIAAEEWRTIERGCIQRVRAMNAFLDDLYHGARILEAGVIPRGLVYTSLQYRRQMAGVDPPGGVYIHVAGIDLVRNRDGTYYVLEDNVRVPSGVSYVLENRTILTALLPGLLRSLPVRSVRDYPDLLGQALRDVTAVNDPRVIVLTPGVFNSAYFEHAFLAREMGIELAEGRDLVVEEDTVYLRTLHGLERVDVIYRRVDDEFLDPVVFTPDSLLGVPGLFHAYRRGRVAIANAIGTGVADDKAVYPFVPAMIRFYLDEEPVLPNVSDARLDHGETADFLRDRPQDYVLKPADRSGGYGVAILGQLGDAERERLVRTALDEPRAWVVQRLIDLSTHPTLVDARFAPRRIDLRPFVICGADGACVLPGGLTRVALPQGSFIVNSSQGGGTKDTWVRRTPACLGDSRMLRRVAQDLCWAGRYFERADCLARFVFAPHRLGLEVGHLGPDPDAWIRRIAWCFGEAGAGRVESGRLDPRETIARVVLSPEGEQSIARCIARAHENARRGRAYLSRETYESLNRLYMLLRDLSPERTEWSFALQRIEQACRVVSGYMGDTVVRDEAWQVLHAGRHLERASQAVRIVRAGAVDGDGRPWLIGARVDPLAWGGLLRSCSAYEAYRKVYRGPIDPLCALELLLVYPAFPRSLRGALGLLRENLLALGLIEAGSFRPGVLDARFNRLSASVTYGGMNTIREEGLAPALDRFQAELAAVGGALEDLFTGVEIAGPNATLPRPAFPGTSGGVQS